jgi:hypothetical protein
MDITFNFNEVENFLCPIDFEWPTIIVELFFKGTTEFIRLGGRAGGSVGWMQFDAPLRRVLAFWSSGGGDSVAPFIPGVLQSSVPPIHPPPLPRAGSGAGGSGRLLED